MSIGAKRVMATKGPGSALVALDGQPSPAASQPAAAALGSSHRAVQLITVSKADPTQRVVRDVGRRPRPSQHDIAAAEAKKQMSTRDEEREAIMACAPYTEHFNALLKRLPKKKHIAQLVLERMRTETPPVMPDTQTYNLLLEKVVDLRDDMAFELFEELREEAHRDDSPVRPDLTTLQLMVRACERRGDYRRAFQIYSQLKEAFGVYPDVPLYNTLIGYCAPLKDEATASFIVEEMRDRGAEADVHTYNSLMNVFAEAPYEVISQAYEDMIKRRLRPNRRTYNTLMRACQRIEDYDKAFLFFEELKHDGLTPDVTTYNVLLSVCRDRIEVLCGGPPLSATAGGGGAGGKHAHKEAALLRVSKETRENALRAIAHLSLSLFAEMDELRVPPNTFTYNALLSVLVRCGDVRLLDVFNQMKAAYAKQHGGRTGQTPSTALVVSSGNALVHAHNATGGADGGGMTAAGRHVLDPTVPHTFTELERLLDGMTHAHDDDDPGNHIAATGVTLTLATYEIVISGAASLQMPERAYELFDEMKQIGIRPDRSVFMRLMNVCAIKAEKSRAFAMFEEAKLSGVAVDADLYNALLNVLAESCDHHVFEVFDDLRHDKPKLSIKPNQESYAIMLKAAFKQRNASAAMALYDEMCSPSCPVAPDSSTYSWLMDVCSLTGDVARATDFILDMKRRHVKVSVTTYTKFLRVFVAANDAGIVEVFENMKRQGPNPNLEAYTILLDYYCSNQNDAIVPLFEELRRSGIDMDLCAFNIMLKYVSLSADFRLSFKYLQELRGRQLVADVETYNWVLAALAPSGSDYIFKVFEEMAECKVAPDSNTFGILLKHQAGRQALVKAMDQHLIVLPSSEAATSGFAVPTAAPSGRH